ncbi:MAG: Crp/Fnr family transcriptional regulator [Erysipelotrichaceae bacterium]
MKNKEEKLDARFGLELADLRDVTWMQVQGLELIIQQGQQMDALRVLVEGAVRVETLTKSGKDLTLSYQISNGILGDIEFLRHQPTALASVVAEVPTTLCCIPMEKNRTVLEANPRFLLELSKSLATKLVGSNHAHVARASMSAMERLCHYIDERANNQMFSEVLSDVAKATGMSYRHVFRLLERLCKADVLEKTAMGYRILNREYLTSDLRDMR